MCDRRRRLVADGVVVVLVLPRPFCDGLVASERNCRSLEEILLSVPVRYIGLIGDSFSGMAAAVLQTSPEKPPENIQILLTN